MTISHSLLTRLLRQAGRAVCVYAVLLLAPALVCGEGTNIVQEPKPMKPKVISQLKQFTQVWDEDTVDVVTPGVAGAAARMERVAAKSVVYIPSALTGEFSLAVFTAPRSGDGFVVRGNQTFYLMHKSDMLAVLVSAGHVSWTPSYFKIRTQAGDSATVARFVAETDEGSLRRADQRRVSVSIRPGVPTQFFLAESNPETSQIAVPRLEGVDVVGDVLRLDLVSDGAKYRGTFWIDLAAKELVRSVLDGREVFKAR